MGRTLPMAWAETDRLDAVGYVTIRVLAINHPDAVRLRREVIAEECLSAGRLSRRVGCCRPPVGRAGGAWPGGRRAIIAIMNSRRG